MDTITHFAAGACIGELIAGHKLGKRAMVAGGFAQLVPDIDFVFGMWMSPAANAMAHRGLTHSILFLILITPVLAWGVRRLWGDKAVPISFWIFFLGVEVLTHLILDAFNAYGTGWFEPFSHLRVSFNAIFVADPFFSLPLGLALVLLLFTRSNFRWRNLIATSALALSATYLAYALYNKWQVERISNKVFALHGIAPTSHFSTPTPFNSWLWYVVATDKNGSYVGYRSVLDQSNDIHFEFFPRNDSLIEESSFNQEEIKTLKQLSQGHYTIEARADTLMFNDLRFGQMLGWQYPRNGFVFHFYLHPDLDNTLVLQRGRFEGWDYVAVKAFLRRILGNELPAPPRE
ncbi:metal-dependent hydrolase [Chryseolinea sp. T2]|uniref:metal-dependent hydrolase n=1 Tax=Chryseolinea sp. T2 TaxID=3129255 RepID=UPI003076A020